MSRGSAIVQASGLEKAVYESFTPRFPPKQRAIWVTAAVLPTTPADCRTIGASDVPCTPSSGLGAPASSERV